MGVALRGDGQAWGVDAMQALVELGALVICILY